MTATISAMVHAWVLVVVASTVGQSTGFGDLQVARAIEARAQGDHQYAFEQLASFLERQSENAHPEVRFLAADTAVILGKAQAALRWAAALDEPLPELQDHILAIRARAHRQLSSWKQAETLWTKLLELPISNRLKSEAHFGRADAAWASGRLSEASRRYEAAISQHARHERVPLARFILTRLQAERGLLREASQDLRDIVVNRPNDPMHRLAVEQYAAWEDNGRARDLTFWEKLRQVDKYLRAYLIPEAQAALGNIQSPDGHRESSALREREAQLAYRLRDFDRALALFEELKESASNRKKLSYDRWIARCYSAGDYTKKAIAAYQQLSEKIRNPREARDMLYKAAWLAYNGRDYSLAINLFGTFVARFPRDRYADAAVWHMAWNAYRLGDIPQALSLVRKIRARYPRSDLVQRSWYWDGRFSEMLGDGTSAETAYQAARIHDPIDYYGFVARQRLLKLRDARSPRFHKASSKTEPVMLALRETDDGIGDTGSTLEPGNDELPTHGGLRERPGASSLPWGASVFHWHTKDAKRLLLMMKLGLHREAVELVDSLEVIKGFDRDEVAYAKARLHFALGDYDSAFRFIQSTFSKELRAELGSENLRFFKISYPYAYEHIVESAHRAFEVRPELILSIMRQESAFRTKARSWASANGLMQIIPATGRKIASALGQEYTAGLLRDPHTNVHFGAWYLRKLMENFEGSVVAAVGSYNAGPTAVSRWIEVNGGLPVDEFIEEVPYRQTRGYIKKVLANMMIYTALYSGELPELEDRIPTSYELVVDF